MKTIEKVARILLDWSIKSSEFEIAEILFKYFNIPISNKTLYSIKTTNSFISFNHFKNHHNSVSIPRTFMTILQNSKYTKDEEIGFCYKYIK